MATKKQLEPVAPAADKKLSLIHIYHRLIHKLNPKFDYNRGCFVFSENSELRIELDFHLMK